MSDGLRITTLTPDLAERCHALEISAFPDTDPAELLTVDDILAYAETFPEGFFVILEGERVVGQGAGIFVDFDFDQPQHHIREVTGEHQCGNHDPAGDWYYGTDIVVHPDHRGRGLGRRLYDLRKELVIRHAKRGIIAGGYPRGYADHAHLGMERYLEAVAAGEIHDPTLSFQLANGFEIRGVLWDYIADPSTDDAAALIVWEAPRRAQSQTASVG